MIVYIIFIALLFLQMFIDKLTSSNRNISKKYQSDGILIYSKPRLNITMKIAILLIVLFSSIRYDVGWDYMAYYETISLNRETNILLNNEYLTILFVKIARWMKEPQLYFALNSCITIFLIMSTIERYSKDIWVSIIFFVTFPLFFLNSLSVVRNFTAIAIIFYGFKYIIEDKLFKYIVIVIIATLFHTSAIVALTFYFFKYFRFDKIKYIVIVAILPILKEIITYLILRYLPRYSPYLGKSTIIGGTKAIYVLLFVLIFFVFLKNKMNLNENNIISISFNIYLCGMCIYLVFFSNGTLGHRLSMYGTMHILLLLPEMLIVFKKRDRVFIKLVLYMMCIVFFFYTIFIGRDTYIPYRLFFR